MERHALEARLNTLTNAQLDVMLISGIALLARRGLMTDADMRILIEM